MGFFILGILKDGNMSFIILRILVMKNGMGYLSCWSIIMKVEKKVGMVKIINVYLILMVFVGVGVCIMVFEGGGMYFMDYVEGDLLRIIMDFVGDGLWRMIMDYVEDVFWRMIVDYVEGGL